MTPEGGGGKESRDDDDEGEKEGSSGGARRKLELLRERECYRSERARGLSSDEERVVKERVEEDQRRKGGEGEGQQEERLEVFCACQSRLKRQVSLWDTRLEMRRRGSSVGSAHVDSSAV